MSRYNLPIMTRKLVWISIALAGLAILARLIPGPRTIDDAFITFRYARNILMGFGFVYNPGEHVLGTTTPLYTLLMVGFGLLAGGGKADFASIAWIFNALTDAATCILLWQIGLRLGSERAGLAAAVIWAVAPYSVTFAIGGMETSLYVLLLTAVTIFYLDDRLDLAALAGAVAFLTRVDALILAIPLGLDWLVRLARRRTRFSWKMALAFGLPMTAWYGFAWVYFGSPFPHSLTAKLVAYQLEPNASLIRLIQHYATPFLEQNLLGVVGIGIGLILYPFLFMIGARRAWRANSRSLPWLVYPWLYFLAFALPNPLIFRWYLTPPLPAYFLVIFLGLDQIWSSVLQVAKKPTALRIATAGGLLLLFPLVSTLSEWRLNPDQGTGRPAPDMAFIDLERLYRQAAKIIKPYLGPRAVLAAGDVGVLGYETSARILDTVGLNSPQAGRYYPLDPALYAINYAVAPDLILDEKPDAVIILEVYGRKGLLKDQRFLSRYRLLETIPTDMYGSHGMLLYERVP